jgi:hypothetical protein
MFLTSVCIMQCIIVVGIAGSFVFVISLEVSSARLDVDLPITSTSTTYSTCVAVNDPIEDISSSCLLIYLSI